MNADPWNFDNVNKKSSSFASYNKKKIFSSFILTINTNKSWTSFAADREMYNRYKHFFQEILSDEIIKTHLITINDRLIKQNNIFHFKSYTEPEVGTKLSRLHFHTHIDLGLEPDEDEQGYLPKVNIKMLRKLIKEHFGYNMHVNCRATSNESLRMEYYVKK